MRAGVVGANWGRVHVHALREHGVDVVALAGDPSDHARTRPAAEQLGIDLALQKPDALLDLELDLVTVATPAVTHPPLLALFAGIPTLCEKPLLGMTGDAALLPRHSPTVWLNYAFPFLDSARVFAKCVRETGTVTEVRIVSLHDLPGAMTGPEWFLEIASHPLSFAVHLFGPPRLDATAQHQADRTKTLLRAHLGDVPAQITCRAEPGLRGIEHRILVRTAGGNIALVGQVPHRRAVALRTRPDQRPSCQRRRVDGDRLLGAGQRAQHRHRSEGHPWRTSRSRLRSCSLSDAPRPRNR